MYGSPLKAELPRLLPERHENRNFFVANILKCVEKSGLRRLRMPKA